MKKPATNNILDGEKLKPFCLRWGTRQRCLAIQHCTGCRSHGNQTTETKDIEIRNKELKYLYMHNMVLYKENPIEHAHVHARTHTRTHIHC